MRRTNAIRAGVAMALLCLAFASMATQEIVISPTGEVTTLSQAQALIPVPMTETVLIRYEPGRYPRETVRWTKTSKDYQVDIRCREVGACTMDGENATERFFHLKSPGGECSRVTIHGLVIRGYLHHGVLLHDSDCNRVVSNTFVSMGNKFHNHYCDRDDGPCVLYSGISTINSDRNIIANNRFFQMQNRIKAGSAHCVYISNGSQANMIRTNTCEQVSGACYKLRDDSNDNQFINNSCEAGPLYLISVAAQPHEIKDQRNLVRGAWYPGMPFASCALEYRGDRSQSNCVDGGVIVNGGQVILSQPYQPPPPPPPPPPPEPEPKPKPPSRTCEGVPLGPELLACLRRHGKWKDK